MSKALKAEVIVNTTKTKSVDKKNKPWAEMNLSERAEQLFIYGFVLIIILMGLKVIFT